MCKSSIYFQVIIILILLFFLLYFAFKNKKQEFGFKFYD